MSNKSGSTGMSWKDAYMGPMNNTFCKSYMGKCSIHVTYTATEILLIGQ